MILHAHSHDRRSSVRVIALQSALVVRVPSYLRLHWPGERETAFNRGTEISRTLADFSGQIYQPIRK
jgi:hypothetical protein